MKRLLTGTLLTLLLVAGALFAVGATNDNGGGNYKVRAIFDDAASAVPGEDVRIAGAKVGTIDSMSVTPRSKAAIVLLITNSGFTPFHLNATCTVRPQSLIGEKYVECDPGTPSSPKLPKIPDGHQGAGQHYLPLRNTSSPVDLDLVNNVMRLPYRQRFAIILSELGAGFAGRGQDLNALIRRANPALRQTNEVLRQLAAENVTLKKLAINSDRSLAPLAAERRHIGGFITHANEVGEATAVQSANIEKSIHLFPTFLKQLKPTLTDLGNLADEMTPTLADLDAASPSLARLVVQIGPFSQSATKSLVSLGKTADVATPVLKDAQPVVSDLKAFSINAKPVSINLDALTASLNKTGGLEDAMKFILYSTTAINGFDEISHYLRAALLVNVCSTYALQPTPGCGARFTTGAAPTSAQATAATRAKATRASSTSTNPGLNALGNIMRSLGSTGYGIGNSRLHALSQQGAANIRAVTDTSPTPGNTGGRDAALLNYLMGND